MSAITIKTQTSDEVSIAAEFVERVGAAITQLDSFADVTSDNVDDAAAALKECVAIRQITERQRKALQRPFLDASKAIKAAADNLTKPLILKEQGLKSAVASYEARRRAAELAAAIAAQEAEREAAEAETPQSELEEEIADLFPGGFGPVPVAIQPAVESKPSGITYIESLTWDAVDKDQLLSAWLQIDARAIRAHLTENRDAIMRKVKASPNNSIDYHGLKISLKRDVRAK